MRLPLLILAAFALAAPGAALAADAEALNGFYDGTAACPGGEVQIMLSIELEAGDKVTGTLMVVPVVDGKIPGGEYKVAGSINDDDWLDLKGPGKIAFAGAWFDAEYDDEPSILGTLADSGCKDFNLERQLPAGPV